MNADTRAEEALHERVQATLLDMLIDRNYLAAVFGIPFAGLICTFAWPALSHVGLLIWLASRLAVSTSRIVLTQFFRRRRGALKPATWEAAYTTALAIDGTLWGSVAVVFASRSQPELTIALLACTVGVAAIGAVVLSSHFRACAWFLTPLLVAPAASQLMLWTPIAPFAAASIFLFFALSLDHSWRTSRDTQELIRLRFELSHAHEQAMAGTRAKSAFLASMSHELRTPLNAVIGLAELLGEADLRPAQREHVDSIRASGELLLSLIGDVLDLSKAEAGRIDVEAIPLDVMSCVEESLEQVAEAATKKGLRLDYSCPDVIRSDRTRLRQILGNLLSNATKFTERGGITVDVSARHLSPDQDNDRVIDRVDPRVPKRVDDRVDDRASDRVELAFAVTDTGVGIDPEALGRLFQPFSQLDASTTRAHGGTGLGLAISKQLSELLGGTMTVTSTPGRGSTFRFTIVAQVAERAKSPVERVEHTEHKKALLCADPHDTPRLSALLCRAHIEVLSADAEPSSQDAFAIVHMSEEREALATRERLVSLYPTLPIVIYPPLSSTRSWERDSSIVLRRPFRVRRMLEVLAANKGGVHTTRPGERTSDRNQDITVLIVDDNELNRVVAEGMVRKLGYHAVSVGGGDEALRYLERSPHTVVLMDVEMPRMDGYETARRATERFVGEAGPYVIGLTAHALAEVQERCIASGMKDFLTKPLRVPALTDALSRVPRWPSETSRSKESSQESSPQALSSEKPSSKESPSKESSSQESSQESGSQDSSDDGVLAMEVLAELRDLGDPPGSLLRELVDTFADTTPTLLNQIRAALDARRFADAATGAHTLKGMAASIGAIQAQTLAGQLERACRAGAGDFAADVTALEGAVATAQRALGSRLGAGRG
jgi:signal transduction histidine kinase/CheY-like chemotaxis protein